MDKLDKTAQKAVKTIYTQFESVTEITVSSPEFKKTVIDYLISQGLLEKTDASALSGWAYIVRPTYYGESTFTKILALPSSKVDAFIKQGEVIMKEEYHHITEPGFAMPDYIDGPKSDQWFSEINIFNSRFLKNHPLYDQIDVVCKKHKRLSSPHEDMMGFLKALALDTDFWEVIETTEETKAEGSRKTIDQMLSDDIKRCEQYLNNPDDESVGQKLYIEITGKYDSIIDDFGNGLYQYIAEYHFYDPEIDDETLKFNLKLLLNKMISFQAVKAAAIESNPNKEGKKMSNKVFIVHGHDNEAKQEMARTLEKGGFEPIILHEQPDSGRTIIEKIERYSDVCYAVVLYTECDKGRDKNTPVEQEQYRARQNVVFEHGYLIGKLGRDHVSALVKGNVETPGDISGIVYTPMDAGVAWKTQLAINMQDIGLPVDMNKFCR